MSEERCEELLARLEATTYEALKYVMLYMTTKLIEHKKRDSLAYVSHMEVNRIIKITQL
jgi:hypothetical protein